MPLKKILFRPGVNRENTRYASESLGAVNSGTQSVGGWYESEKIRFRQGTPEKLGGWAPNSLSQFLGVCRSMWNWITLGGLNLVGLGTNLKFYIERGGVYNDITPIRLDRTAGTALTNPFTATLGSTIITVADTANGSVTGDFVTFSGATGLGGNITATVLNQEYQLTVVNSNSYTIDVGVAANATDVSGSPGGGTVDAEYQLNVGPAFQIPNVGWGAGAWGSGVWGTGGTSFSSLRLWSQANFGEDLVFGPRGGGLYYWDATNGVTDRGVLVSSLPDDSDVPVVQNYILISDASRFVFVFGTNDYGSSTLNPMLIRWSDQESVTQWTPDITNQASSLQLSHGSEIITAIQARQEIVVFTDSAVYSLQYQGPPAVWGSQLLGDNISIMGQNAASIASGVVYWMGIDKFYKYDGRVQTMRCDLRQYIYSDINLSQKQQFFAGTNEGFNEVWWFYCSANSTTIDKYVIYNYAEDVWYYGTMERTAWLDSGLRNYPMAATYDATETNGRLLNHEFGVDNNVDGTPVGMVTSISSSEFDIDDGHNFGFVYRILPDLTFRGSTGSTTPQVTMTLIPLANSGSGYNSPQSEGGSSNASIQRIATAPVEEFTGQVFVRVRGRQMVFKIDSTNLGTQWQIGAPRIDIKTDGRRGNS
jgi:hypothetical protein